MSASLAGAIPYPAAVALPASLAPDSAQGRFPARAEGTGYLPVPAAEAAELMVAMRSAEAVAYAGVPALPEAAALPIDTSLDPQRDDIIPEPATAHLPVPAAEAAEMWVVPVEAAPAAFAVWPISAKFTAIEMAEAARTIPSAGYLPGLMAQPVETFVFPAVSSLFEFAIPAAILPPVSSLSIEETHVASSSRLARSLEAETVSVEVRPSAWLVPAAFTPGDGAAEVPTGARGRSAGGPGPTAPAVPELPAARHARRACRRCGLPRSCSSRARPRLPHRAAQAEDRGPRLWRRPPRPPKPKRSKR